jgi:phospholipid transport system substrate-binding protein
MNRRFLIPLALVLVFHGAAGADYSTPRGRVQDAIGRVIAVLKDASLDREARWERIAAVIDDSFDFRSMSQSVLATHWKRASPEERERFIEFFSRYIEETYRARIEAYSDQEIRFGGEVIRGDRAIVETVIVTKGGEIPVNFKLKNNDGQWYAYDVVVEGTSLVANYQNTFAAIVKNEGMEGLLSDIERRIERYRSAHPEGDAAASPAGS